MANEAGRDGMTDKPTPTAPGPFSEAAITINGHALTVGQSMTVRCAIEGFASSLSDGGLGDDEHGRRMTEGYLARIREIRGMVVNG